MMLLARQKLSNLFQWSELTDNSDLSCLQTAPLIFTLTITTFCPPKKTIFWLLRRHGKLARILKSSTFKTINKKIATFKLT